MKTKINLYSHPVTSVHNFIIVEKVPEKMYVSMCLALQFIALHRIGSIVSIKTNTKNISTIFVFTEGS
jgi:hypothetical protein